jgi:hypothetical protein
VALVLLAAPMHGFLATTDRTAGEILVVEAWFWNRPALKEAVEEFHRGHYKCLVVVGGPSDEDSRNEATTSSADLAAKRLRDWGCEEQSLVVLRTPWVEKHRTYATAISFKSWMLKHHPQTKAINLFSLGVHARKSRLLFQKALGLDVTVGVIAGTEDAYPPTRWWSTARGIRLVLRNFVGYLYARLWSPPADSEKL